MLLIRLTLIFRLAKRVKCQIRKRYTKTFFFETNAFCEQLKVIILEKNTIFMANQKIKLKSVDK